ncbi:MAG: patatin-like phospholipase family protein [Treponema sp.]|nr:patatin-like phospholipase family protein [Treponema sp.]
MKNFNILSIDGGGILGLYSASMLEQIQKEFCNGRPLSEKFNLMAGTSTGGIIALALALGSDASRIVEFYKNFGEKIFPKKHRFGCLKEKYSNIPLKKALENFFGDKTISNCKSKVCIPAIDAVNCQPIIFKTNNNGKLNRDENTKLVDIALATSAAPTYFPMYAFDNFLGLVDGGLWQNNPALFAVIEAVNYFVGEGKEFDCINILSIGNPLSALPNSIKSNSTNSSIAKLNINLVTLPMKISSIGTNQILSFLYKNHALNVNKYLRIESQNVPNDIKKLSLDLATEEAFNLMLSRCANDFNQNKCDLYDFFKEN